MVNPELQEMDNAAVEAETELSVLYSNSQLSDGIESIGSWMVKWVPTAGYKRLGRILREYAKKEG